MMGKGSTLSAALHYVVQQKIKLPLIINHKCIHKHFFNITTSYLTTITGHEE